MLLAPAHFFDDQNKQVDFKQVNINKEHKGPERPNG
jgi:hypothetical protein